jgi:toxin ParE1/3/4
MMWYKDPNERHDMRTSKPITVTLGPQLASLEARLKSGEYASASEVLRSAPLTAKTPRWRTTFAPRSRPRSRIPAPASRQPTCSSACAPATQGIRKQPSVAPKVVFRPQAEADLVGLYEYIAERAGYRIAGGTIDRIEEACMALATFPKRGKRRDDILPGLRAIGFERRVTIAFRILKSPVEIVTIAYAGRNFEDDLQG